MLSKFCPESSPDNFQICGGLKNALCRSRFTKCLKQRVAKEVWRRDGLQAEPRRDVKVGKVSPMTMNLPKNKGGNTLKIYRAVNKE